MLFRETVAVYCGDHTEHANTLCGQNAEFIVLKQTVPTAVHPNINTMYFGINKDRMDVLKHCSELFMLT
jgi:hypothetical protein